MATRLRESSGQNDRLRDECQRLHALSERQALELQEYKTKYESLTMGNTSVIHTLDRKIKDFQHNLQSKDENL